MRSWNAFGNKETTLKRLRKGESNKSDLGGVLQTNNIHIAVCKPGEVTRTLVAELYDTETTPDDLRAAFPEMKGFSRAYLMYIRASAEA